MVPHRFRLLRSFCSLLLVVACIYSAFYAVSHIHPVPRNDYRLELYSVSATKRKTASSASLANSLANNRSIPKIMHQVFASEMVYENYRQFINSCLALNPDWDYYLWTDRDAEKLIRDRYPRFLTKFKRYTDNLERADSIRYIVLHHMGGIYMDMDVECIQPFFPALQDLPAFLDKERTEQTKIEFYKAYSAMNSVMGSRSGHPFYEHMIQALMKMQRVGDALRTTGPHLLTSAYESYQRVTGNKPHVRLLEPRLFSPLMADMPSWKKKCAGSTGKRGTRSRVRAIGLKQQGCQELEATGWSPDIRDNSTIGVHHFLHLGYDWIGGKKRKALFNVTKAFPARVKFYSRG